MSSLRQRYAQVANDPQYRITVLMKCKKINVMDHRPVDRAALKRQLHWATEVKTLASVRETANDGKIVFSRQSRTVLSTGTGYGRVGVRIGV